jgi:hypothetical protein
MQYRHYTCEVFARRITQCNTVIRSPLERESVSEPIVHLILFLFKFASVPEFYSVDYQSVSTFNISVLLRLSNKDVYLYNKSQYGYLHYKPRKMDLFNQDPNKKQLPLDKALDFILAGKSTFTIRSAETGKHFTYKITAPKAKRDNSDVHFVKLMTGSDNESSFSFFGTIFNKKAFKHSGKGKISPDALGVRSFTWFMRNLMNGTVNGKVELFHEGCCGRCGRKLTTPESVTLGIGPECAKMLNK